jgi:hypothetical protein
MKTIDLTTQDITLKELLQWATINPVRIVSPTGHSFVLEESDVEFEREVALLGQSDAFMNFLVERSQESGGITLDEFEQTLATEATFASEIVDDIYRETFKNRYGEEWIFEYNILTGKALVKGSDVEWEEYEVVEGGQAVNLLLNDEEIQWLRQAWLHATERLPAIN